VPPNKAIAATMNRQTWVVRWLAGNGALLESGGASVVRSGSEGEGFSAFPGRPDQALI
jgi:hypothetical protein